MKNRELVLLTLSQHMNMLNSLGIHTDKELDEIPDYEFVYLYKNNKVVGKISFEEKNMFYLYRDNRIVGNRDLSKINFNKRKEKNIRSVVHLRLYDKNLKFNGYNQLISEDRPYISITDNENYRITKYINNDELIIESLREDISDDNIIDELTGKNKKLTYNLEGV